MKTFLRATAALVAMSGASAVSVETGDALAMFRGSPSQQCLDVAEDRCGHCTTNEYCWATCVENNVDEFHLAGCEFPEGHVKSTGPSTADGVGGVPPEPASCKNELKKLCGHCGLSKSCWKSCAVSNKAKLLHAGCKPPTSTAADSVGSVPPEPASCKNELKKLCGHCGLSKSCWKSCAVSNKAKLLNAGCKPPTSAFRGGAAANPDFVGAVAGPLACNRVKATTCISNCKTKYDYSKDHAVGGACIAGCNIRCEADVFCWPLTICEKRCTEEFSLAEEVTACQGACGLACSP